MSNTPHDGFDRELSVRAIQRFGIVLTLILAGAFALMFALNRGLLNLRERQAPQAPPLPELAARPQVPEPRLQTHPEQDWTQWRAEQATELSSYRLLDAASGRVQIPIEAAMQELVARESGAAEGH
jgi:hypothetical protein